MIDKYKKRSAWLNDIYLNVSLHILIANIIASFQGPVRWGTQATFFQMLVFRDT